MRPLSLLLVVAFVIACGPSASGTPTAPSTAACPVTTPPPVAFPPPTPLASGINAGLAFTAGPGNFLYGNDALVVILANDGLLHPSDPSRGLAGGMKFPWWRSVPGELVIATRRLDGQATPLPAHVPSGYGETGFQVSGLDFPIAGCWEIKGSIATKSLSFVVRVVDR